MSSSRKEGPRPCSSPATTNTAAVANTATHSTLAGSTEKLDIEDKDGEKDVDTETNTETEANTETDTVTENSDFGSSEEEDGEGDSPVNLDRVLFGPCSICGSPDHEDEDCEEEPDPRYLMTTALPRPHASDDTSHLSSSPSSSGKGDQNGLGGSQNSYPE